MNRKISENAGFTLLEVMIVVAVISILAAIAIPNYRDYLVRAQRTDAMDSLTEIMNQQQRFQTKNRAYAADLQNLGYPAATYTSPEEYYVVTATACGASIARCVLLTAVPQAGEAQAGDYNITINSLGQKSFTEPGTTNVLEGWSHRTVLN